MIFIFKKMWLLDVITTQEPTCDFPPYSLLVKGLFQPDSSAASYCATQSFASNAVIAAEFLALKHESRILGHSSNPVCGFSMIEQV